MKLHRRLQRWIPAILLALSQPAATAADGSAVMAEMMRQMLDSMGIGGGTPGWQQGPGGGDWSSHFPAPEYPDWSSPGPGYPPIPADDPALWLDGHWLGKNGMLLVFRQGLLRIYTDIDLYQDFHVTLRSNWLLLKDPLSGQIQHFELAHQMGWLGLRNQSGEIALFRRIN